MPSPFPYSLTAREIVDLYGDLARWHASYTAITITIVNRYGAPVAEYVSHDRGTTFTLTDR